jgi:hypothetical protein
MFVNRKRPPEYGARRLTVAAHSFGIDWKPPPGKGFGARGANETRIGPTARKESFSFSRPGPSCESDLQAITGPGFAEMKHNMAKMNEINLDETR